ncbi:MAG: SDR family oxidoreductase [Chitinophagaceae bacterium]|nr:SDR family oxidoreductase [Chitinophagaceae bacterium]
MDLHLKDKVIIVTGGAKGIGNAICQSLAEEGATPVIVGRNEIDNQKAVKEIKDQNLKSIYITAELGGPEASEEVVKKTVSELGRIDGLVNNAGLNDGVSLANGSYEAFIKSLHNSLTHYYLTAHYALPELIKTKGSIVNIGSKTGETGQGGTSGYAASNGGRNALTREWAVELLKYSIRVNSVIVAECFTPQYADWVATLGNPEEELKRINERIPLGHRMTKPREIADMVTFLLSDRSSHTTGQLIHVDGGYVHLDRAIS